MRGRAPLQGGRRAGLLDLGRGETVHLNGAWEWKNGWVSFWLGWVVLYCIAWLVGGLVPLGWLIGFAYRGIE